MPDSTYIRNVLSAGYHRDQWKTLLTTLFPEGSLTLLRRPEPLAATHEKVTATYQLGTITLPILNTQKHL